MKEKTIYVTSGGVVGKMVVIMGFKGLKMAMNILKDIFFIPHWENNFLQEIQKNVVHCKYTGLIRIVRKHSRNTAE